MQSDEKVFVLGLGAQKSGTSWLHDYLNSDASADFGSLKEYHIWDALTLADARHFDIRRGRVLNRGLMMLVACLKRDSQDNVSLRAALQQDPERYFDHFAELLDQDGINLTGDITPSYMALDAQTLAALRNGFAKRGITVKSTFIMRDPISRAISAVQMNRRKRDWREGVPLLGSLDAALLSYVQSSKHQLRADYAGTVGRMREVFDPENTHIYIFETMFALDHVKTISSDFNVTFRPERVSNRVYGATVSESVTEETKAELYQILQSTYQFCAEEFPATRTLWHSAPAGRSKATEHS